MPERPASKAAIPAAPLSSAPSAAADPDTPRYFSTADAACIARVLAGETERFEELVTRYQNAVLATVRGSSTDAARAEDLAQDVFVSAFSALKTLRDPHYFLPWLLQIARHRAAHHSRRESRKPDGTPLSMDAPLPEPDHAHHERLQCVFQSVNELPEPYRQTVLLKYAQGRSCKEIAEKEGVAVGTITSRLTRALHMLRGALTGEEKNKNSVQQRAARSLFSDRAGDVPMPQLTASFSAQGCQRLPKAV